MRHKFFLACIVCALSACSPAAPEMRPLTIKRTDGSVLPLQVEIADSPAERAQGLMGRRDLADRHGMLFIFPEEDRLRFWMKNTPLFLDIIFINSDGKILSIHPKARPYDETAIPSLQPAQYVLEIKGGEAAALNITPGDHIILR